VANIWEPTDIQKSEWDEWVKARPDRIREVAERFYPWKLYRLKNSGHRVLIHSIDEPADNSEPTLKVLVTGQFNVVCFERTVFGIKPSDLEECGLPSPDEITGSLDMSIDDVKEMMKS
jgi:hypothetical protein